MPSSKFDVLVVGGTGFIGEYLVAELVRLNLKIAVFHSDFYESPFSSAISYFRDDIAGNTLENLISHSKNLIYLAPPVSGLLDRFLTSISSSESTRTVLYISTILLYKGGLISQKEDGPLLPVTSYAKEKKIEEDKMISFSGKHKNIKVIIARLGNVYGDIKNRGLIREVFQSFFKKDKSEGVVISGDGKQIRDFVFVDDVSQALTRLLITPGISTCIVNVTTGLGNSLLEVISKIEKITGEKVAYKFGQPVPETFSVIGDNSNLKSIIGWAPGTDLESGLRKTYKRYIMKNRKYE